MGRKKFGLAEMKKI